MGSRLHTVFDDTETAEACLAHLRETCGDGFMEVLNAALADMSDPQKALVGITRFLERCLSSAAEVERMLASPRYLAMLTTLFSQSTLMSDILCRNPEYGSWLWSEAALERAREPEEMRAMVDRAFDAHRDFESRKRWMRRHARVELLRIAVREIFAHAPFESIGADISLLADTMLEAAIVAAREELAPRFSALVAEEDPEQEVTFVVLAMGKLGGQELNFSSDIDLLFLYSANGHTLPDSPKSATTEEYFRKLSELIIKAVSEQTAEGRAFRVDMRLRPYGKSGPLACALDSAVEYYSTYGRAWERQALIKARPCAGDLALGEVFLERLRPFIYPRYFDDATLEDIRGIKRQTEAVIAAKEHTEREVKLGRGGIRDIEFTVQILQLLHGGRWPDSRTTNTLQAIRALGARQRLRPFEAETLERNYIFLRQVEHRLQIEGGLQTHVLPETSREMDALARRLGYEDSVAFMNVYRERTFETRTILEQFLATKGDGNLWVIELLDPDSACETGLERLKRLGFGEPERARAELLLLANGPEHAPYTRDTAQQFAEITPFLLDALARAPDPVAALLRFGQILSQLPVPATLYNLLKYNPKLTHYMVALISNSDYFSEMLVRDISLLEVLGTPGHLENVSTREALEAELSALRQAVDSGPALYRLRDGETLKVALRELTQGVSVAAVGDELSQLAELVVDDTVRMARAETAQRYGTGEGAFAVLALGKFGGRELGYGSDLDLVFVYDEVADNDLSLQLSATEYYGAIASRTLKQLKEPTRYGVLYDVDARLRPDGSKGALAIPEQRLRQYYLEEAQFWERFALMKVRAVAGDPGFMRHIEGQARDIAFSVALDRAALEGLEKMRRQLASTASPFDLKRRQGGIAEIEFSTRLLQLRHVAANPELKRGGVFGALDILREKGLLAGEAHESLVEGYAFFRQLLNRSRMMRGSSSSRIPDSPDNLRRLSACLGLGGDMMERVEYHAQRIHRIYSHIYEQVCGEAQL